MKTLDQIYIEISAIAVSMEYHGFYQKIKDCIKIYKLGKQAGKRQREVLLKTKSQKY